MYLNNSVLNLRNIPSNFVLISFRSDFSVSTFPFPDSFDVAFKNFSFFLSGILRENESKRGREGREKSEERERDREREGERERFLKPF